MQSELKSFPLYDRFAPSDVLEVSTAAAVQGDLSVAVAYVRLGPFKWQLLGRLLMLSIIHGVPMNIFLALLLLQLSSMSLTKKLTRAKKEQRKNQTQTERGSLVNGSQG